MEFMSYYLCVWILCGLCVSINTAPPKRAEKAGPCIGMDCLHGVMMHGDDKVGDDHKAQDTFDRLNKQDSDRQTGPIGPCKGLDCLHDIMHEGDGGVKVMHQKIGPEAQQKEGPEHGMEYMHGVLMHGDDQPGKAHKVDDEPRKKSSEHPPDGPCVDCLEGRLHSTHLERAQDIEDETEIPVRTKSGTADPDKLLHGDGSNHEHKAQETASSKEKKPVSGVTDPDNFLHADGEKHGEKKDEDFKNFVIEKSVAMDPEKLLHGEEGHHEGGQEAVGRQNPKIHPKSGTFDPEVLLHGEGANHIHDPSNTHSQPQARVKSQTFDPDILLHGGKKHAHEPKQETKDNTEAHKHDENDFKQWLKRKIKGNGGDNGGSWGFSFPYISDTLLDEIEQMKQRYIIQPIWGSGEGAEKKEDKTKEEQKTEEVKPKQKVNKELAALQEALMDVDKEPCVDCDKGKDHAHSQKKTSQTTNVHNQGARQVVEEDGTAEDMRHELDKIGSTKSFRSDVDIAHDKQKQNDDQNKERLHGL